MIKIILILLLMIGGGCSKRKPISLPPIPVPQPVPIPTPIVHPVCFLDGLERFPNLKVYSDLRGRQFCYDDSEAQADPSLLSERWDKAGEQIKAIRPVVDLEDPFPLNSTIFKFMPHDGINAYGEPDWNISRVPDMNAYSYPQRIIGLTIIGAWPFVIYALAEEYTSKLENGYRPPLSVVRHEAVHLRWFGFFPNEVCPGSDSAPVFYWVGHGTTCDPFVKAD